MYVDDIETLIEPLHVLYTKLGHFEPWKGGDHSRQDTPEPTGGSGDD